MRNYDSFPQFSRLPLEVRHLIWIECLPRRIAEEDVPYNLLNGQGCRQACWPIRSTYQNARVPLIASVNSEARQVVLKWGYNQVSQDGTSLHSIWLQPKIDSALHLNWTRARQAAFYQVFDAWVPQYDNTPLAGLICRARYDHDMQVSLVGDLIHDFDLSGLMLNYDLKSLTTESLYVPVIGREHEKEDDHYKIVAYNATKTINLTLMAISLHANQTTALASGLFGLLGDAPVQIIDFDNTPRLIEFYNLYKSVVGLREAEPHVDNLFKAILGHNFHAAVTNWRNKAIWLLQVALWKWMQEVQPESFGNADPGLVWKPRVSIEQFHMRMSEHLPNEDHPWWAQCAQQHMPKVMPQVMVRLCNNQCFRPERRPANFGQAWFDSNRRSDEPLP